MRESFLAPIFAGIPSRTLPAPSDARKGSLIERRDEIGITSQHVSNIGITSQHVGARQESRPSIRRDEIGITSERLLRRDAVGLTHGNELCDKRW